MNDDILKVIYQSLEDMDNPADLVAMTASLKEKLDDNSIPMKNKIYDTITLITLMINYALESQNQLAQSLYKARKCLNYHRDI